MCVVCWPSPPPLAPLQKQKFFSLLQSRAWHFHFSTSAIWVRGQNWIILSLL
jgi:hypothetical protein